jgi:hypothetical protein
MKHKQAKGEDFSKRRRFSDTYCIWMDLNKNIACHISNSKIVNCWSQEYVIAVDREQVPRMWSCALYWREVCLPSQILKFCYFVRLYILWHTVDKNYITAYCYRYIDGVNCCQIPYFNEIHKCYFCRQNCIRVVKAELMAYNEEPSKRLFGSYVICILHFLFLYFSAFGRFVQNNFQKWYGKSIKNWFDISSNSASVGWS